MRRIYSLPGRALALLSCLALTSFAGSATASDPDQPHAHRGVLPAYSSAPAAAVLTPEEVTKLEQWDLVVRHAENDEGGSGVAVQYIRAAPETIWTTILSYDRYRDWVDNVKSCTVYQRVGDDIYVDMQISVMGFGSGFYTKNTVRMDQGYMSWTLDYDRKSDVDDMIGYWRVEAVSAEPPVTKLEYSTQIRMRGVPSFVVRYLTKDSLSDGTAWVKLRSEQAAGVR